MYARLLFTHIPKYSLFSS